MRIMGLRGVVRDKKVSTTVPDPAAAYPLDRVDRQFKALRLNALWVSDFTSVATWVGFVYVAFVTDVLARRIVGWRVSRTAHAGFVLDALEQALHHRRPFQGSSLVHHSDRGSHCLALRYPQRLVDAGVSSKPTSLRETRRGSFSFRELTFNVTFDVAEVVVLDWTFVRMNASSTTLHRSTGEMVSEANQELFMMRKRADGCSPIARYSFSPTNSPAR